MERIQIKVSDYYGNPSYYSVMPQEMFDILELETLKGEEYALVDKTQFETMVESYKKKIECNESHT